MSDDVREISQPLSDAKMWMKLTGVMAIVQAVLITISTLGIGLIVAWIPIWLGILLFQAASAVERANTEGDRAALIQSQQKLKVMFIVAGVLTLISVVLAIIGFFAGGMALLGGMGHMG